MASKNPTLALVTEPVEVKFAAPRGKGPSASLTPFLSKQGNGCAVLAPVDVLPGDVGKYFRGLGLPALADSLPEVATVTIGTGKSKTVVRLDLADGETSSGNPRRRGDATAEHDGDRFRVTVQASETSKGWWVIATVIPGGSGGGAPMVSEASNPFGG